MCVAFFAWHDNSRDVPGPARLFLSVATGRSMSGTLALVDFHAKIAAVKRANDNPSLFEQDIGLLLEAVDALEDDDHEFAESDYIYYHACKFVQSLNMFGCKSARGMSIATVICII